MSEIPNKYIKVNIPLTERDYLSGNGEGVWVEVDERVEVVLGIQCMVRREKFPDGRYRDVYRFTVPGWPECSTTGIRSAKRVIHGRLDPAVRNTLGIE